jgi:thiol:disulfide interchange protein DsbD
MFMMLTTASFITGHSVSFDSTPINDHETSFNVTIDLDKDEYLIKDSIHISSTLPDVKLTHVEKDDSFEKHYSPTFSTKDNTIIGYKDNAFITGKVVSQDKPLSDIHESSDQIHLTYQTTAQQKPFERTFSITNKGTTDHSQDNQKHSQITQETKETGNLFERTTASVMHVSSSWKDTLTGWFSTTGSRFVRFIITFFIGVILSLTPCLYPMIPVTVGIIQAAGSPTLIRNFFISLCYTLGVAITFATLGLVTALGGTVASEMQTSPFFIIPVVTLLAYLGFATFGLYEMYIPRFLQTSSSQKVKKGSAISAFVFGMISGTVASPCLSPGLALVLSFIIKISQAGTAFVYAESFFLLFVFGVGSSLPLLIIGTFSNSLKVLPKAGMWMVEVKKLLGLMLLGMCFYFLQVLIPWHILIWILCVCIFALGVYYFMSISNYDSRQMKIYKNIAGVVCIIIFFFVSIQAYKDTYNHLYMQDEIDQNFWTSKYEDAVQRSEKENKYLFLDFGTENCPSCKAIDAQVLSKDDVQAVITEHYIPMKVDGTHRQNEPYNTLKQHIRILGFPTIVIFDPVKNKEIHRWTGSVPDIPEFITQLKRYTQ